MHPQNTPSSSKAVAASTQAGPRLIWNDFPRMYPQAFPWVGWPGGWPSGWVIVKAGAAGGSRGEPEERGDLGEPMGTGGMRGWPEEPGAPRKPLRPRDPPGKPAGGTSRSSQGNQEEEQPGLRWAAVGNGGLRWAAVGCGGLRWAAVACGGRRWPAVAVLHWILATWAFPALDSERLGASKAGFAHFGRLRGWILSVSIRRKFNTTLGSQKHYSC